MSIFVHAKAIVSKLVKAGYLAYFAGGWVRDYLMNNPSEDIDIATSASPMEVMDLFPQTIPVGLNFGVVIVVIQGYQFEVATFRKDLAYVDGRHPTGIELSNPKEDALRRDFTINGMFYDPIEEKIYDFVEGEKDLKLGIIRTIGDPEQRFFEDRLRMLRAFRFSARFAFPIAQETKEAIYNNADKLFPAVAMERVWQEFNKMVTYPRFDQALIEMQRATILQTIFPELQEMHLTRLKQIVAIYAKFPKNCPTILYLAELFAELSLEEKIDIGRRLKVTNCDLKLMEYCHRLFVAIENEEESLQNWAHLLAHTHYQLGLEVYQARLTDFAHVEFVQKMDRLFRRLKPHIRHIQAHQPIINATYLQNLGIKPSKNLGLLLKEAEKIAIERDLHDPQAISHLLIHSVLWSQVT